MTALQAALDHAHMTLKQAAGRTGLSATTLRRYIKSGRLKARLVPGRYGPEYVVGDEELAALGFADAAPDEQPAGAPPALPVPAQHAVVPAPPVAAAPPAVPAADAVPSLLYRELLMKHEHLLVQYGMLRASGQQLLEVRREAERRAHDSRRAAEELERLREKHAREIGQLKARLRQSELALAEREDEIQRLRRELQRAEMVRRNAETITSIDEEFSRLIQRGPVPATRHEH
ncbi:MAG: hypothetical protein KBD01_19960 [Acidobacteria bacterium]|nr:hypothetical protein [Acidobacteriota bacterium]